LLAINFRLAPTVSSSSLPATNPDALLRHQLKETVRPLNLWMQVQKSSKFVDFIMVGAFLHFLKVHAGNSRGNAPICELFQPIRRNSKTRP